MKRRAAADALPAARLDMRLSHGGRKVTADFSAGYLSSSDGGAVFLRGKSI
jgi:hypothetical protein